MLNTRNRRLLFLKETSFFQLDSVIHTKNLIESLWEHCDKKSVYLDSIEEIKAQVTFGQDHHLWLLYGLLYPHQPEELQNNKILS